MHAAKERVFAAQEALRDRMVSFLQRLVRIPSSRGHEKGCQDLMASTMKEYGLEVDAFDVDVEALQGKRGFTPVEWTYADRPNVVGVLKGTGGGRSLILNAHIDTTETGPRELWERDPCSGDIVGNILHGRGASDDKSGCTEMVFLAAALRNAGILLKGDLILQSVIEEETTGNGTLACMARGYDADAAVIVDGTNRDTVITAHSGGVHVRISILGRPGPSAGNPSAANAIHEACGIVAALHELQDRKNAALPRSPSADHAPCPYSMHATGIEGGEGLGNVAARCVVECTAHFSPEDTVRSVQGEIEACVAEATARSPWLREHPPRLTYHALSHDAVAARQDSELVRLLQRCGRETLGVSIRPTAVAGWGDMRHFSLNKPTDCCFYGPGVYGGGMHSPDEYAELDGMLPVSRVLASLVLEWCGSA